MEIVDQRLALRGAVESIRCDDSQIFDESLNDRFDERRRKRRVAVLQDVAQIAKVAVELIDVPLCLRRRCLARGSGT